MADKPTVTELLDLLNKPALMKWANKIGLQGTSLDDYRKKSKAAGLSLHSQVENFLKHGEAFADPTIDAAFASFMAGKNILAIEKTIETEWFVGRYDIKLDIGGKSCLCDFKSSDGIYLENVLQLTAYNMAEPSDCIAIIEMPSFRFKRVSLVNPIVAEDMLKALSYIWRAKKAIDYSFLSAIK